MICNHLIKEGYEDVFQVGTHSHRAVVQLALAVLMLINLYFFSCEGEIILTFGAMLPLHCLARLESPIIDSLV